jgi:hypothetical protein
MILNILRIAAIIIVPVVVAFHTANMWSKSGIFVVEDPTVSFTGRYLLRAFDAAGNEYLYASSGNIQKELEYDSRNAAPFVSAASDDVDGDGKPDLFIFNIAIAPRVASTTPIMKVEFLPTFDYEFHASNQINLYHKMNSGILVTAERDVTQLSSKNSATSVFSVQGNLEFKQVNPLDAFYVTSYAEHYADSLLTDSNVKTISDIRRITAIAGHYGMRNESLHFDVKGSGAISSVNADVSTQTVLAASAARNPDAGFGLFTMEVKMKVVPAVVVYKPSPAEVAKVAWISKIVFFEKFIFFFFSSKKVFSFFLFLKKSKLK